MFYWVLEMSTTIWYECFQFLLMFEASQWMVPAVILEVHGGYFVSLLLICTGSFHNPNDRNPIVLDLKIEWGHYFWEAMRC